MRRAACVTALSVRHITRLARGVEYRVRVAYAMRDAAYYREPNVSDEDS